MTTPPHPHPVTPIPRHPHTPILPYGRQSIDDDDIAAVVAALRSDFLTTGPKVAEFEAALAAYCGARHAIAVANGTAALHLAALAAGFEVGDRVLTSANTFLASANAAEFVGATADFADIDPRTGNLTPETLAAAWQPDVAGVVAVAFAGRPCDMPAIAALARHRGAVVIEDAAHAIGSEIEHDGQRYKIGGHPWADMTTFSFHPVKTITTGEGGAILTNDDTLAERCRRFRNHGMVRGVGDGMGVGAYGGRGDGEAGDLAASPSQPATPPRPYSHTPILPPAHTPTPPAPWYYEMPELGFNYRLTDLQAALGISQLAKLNAFIARRQAITDRYNNAFSSLPHAHTPIPPHSPTPIHPHPHTPPAPPRIAWHLYVLQMDFAAMGKTRTQVMEALKAAGVGTQVHYIPVHIQPYYRNRYDYGPGKCPAAEAYYERCLSLPLYPALTDEDVERVIAAVSEVCGA